MATSWMVMFVGLVLWICSLPINRPLHAETPDGSTIVLIFENGFNPSLVTIEAGMAVTWTNQTQQTVHLRSGEPYHTYLPLIVDSRSGATRLSSPQEILSMHTQPASNWVDHDLGPGQSYSHTFTELGDYPLFLTTQPTIRGLIKVVEPVSPLFETVLSINAESGYANTADNASLDLGTDDGEDFTIETFFHVSDLDYDDQFIDLLARKDHSYSLYISFNRDAPDWVSFKLWTGTDTFVTLSYISDLALGWHHVAAVFDNEFTEDEDLVAIYLDGKLVANSPDENIHVDWTPGILNSSSELLIGGVPSGSAGFNGLIEEMRFSDVVRYSGVTYAEPTAPFVNDTNTRALWHFNETAGLTTFVDDSDNDNTLTGHEAQTQNP